MLVVSSLWLIMRIGSLWSLTPYKNALFFTFPSLFTWLVCLPEFCVLSKGDQNVMINRTDLVTEMNNTVKLCFPDHNLHIYANLPSFSELIKFQYC